MAQNLCMRNTLFTGKVLLQFDELPSTNDYAAEWLAGVPDGDIAKSRPPEGSVVRTAMQSAGRGQHGSSWESEHGKNLTLSLIFYPKHIRPDQQFLLSQACSLGVHAAISQFTNKNVWVKWPNDLYIQNRKAAGILIQNSISGQSIKNSIWGIGLNVNQIRFSNPLATSIALESGQTPDLEDVYHELIFQIEQQYLDLKAGRFQHIREEYLNNLLGLNQMLEFETPDGNRFSGIIRGINPDGHLLVEKAGTTREFRLKELKFLLKG